MASQRLTASSEKKATGAVLAIHDETRAEDKENEVLLRQHEAQKRGKSARVPLAAIDTSPVFIILLLGMRWQDITLQATSFVPTLPGTDIYIPTAFLTEH